MYSGILFGSKSSLVSNYNIVLLTENVITVSG